jgi:hypothetical protein
MLGKVIITLWIIAGVLILPDINFAQVKFEILTPDSEINQLIKGKPLSEVDLLVYAENSVGLTIDPTLPADWRWFAGKGYTSKGSRVEFIFWEGHLYASSVEVCAFRNREYPDIITDRIRSNTFTIGIRKYDETLVFVATEEPKDVHLVIDESVFGEEKILDFHLDKSQGTLVRIFPKDPPFRP